jgi:VCBS repeat-containing protein
MTEWVYSTNRKNATGEALSEPVTYTYTYVVHGEDGSDTTYTTTKTFDHDTEEYRLTKFKAELKD